MKNFLEFIKKNRLLILVFLISTIFFLWQHYADMSWDFSAYAINAKYFFSKGDYFEVYRAPLVSVILGIFLFLGKTGEFIAIFLINLLFFISNLKLGGSIYDTFFSKNKFPKKDFQIIFYLLSLNASVLFYGTLVGTELLSLSLFELFLAYFIRDKYSGHFLALAVLARYNFLFFVPLIFFNRKPKKILVNLILFSAVLAPWLIFNYVKWGNFFTSIVDSYYLNIYSRRNSVQAFNFFHALIIINWLIPFFVLGIFLSFKKLWKHKLLIFLFFAIFLITLFDYWNTPYKISRYLFDLSLPAAFFSSVFFVFFIERCMDVKKLVIASIFLVFLISIFAIIGIYDKYHLGESDELFKMAAEKISENNLTSCAIHSSQWVPINYYTGNVYFNYGASSVLSDNQAVLIIKNIATPEDNLSGFMNISTIYLDDNIKIVAKKGYNSSNCKKRTKWNYPMYPQTCHLISERFSIFNKTAYDLCRIFNKN